MEYAKEIKEKFLLLRSENKKVKEISDILIVPERTIRRWIQHGINFEKKPKPINPKIEESRVLRFEGKTLDEIAEIVGANKNSINKWVIDIALTPEQKMKINSRKNQYFYNTDIFINPNNLTYYILGAFISDGCIDQSRRKCSISSKDKDWIESIRDIISPTHPIRKIKNGNCWVFEISSKFITDWFIANECTPKKSLTVKFPKIPEQFIPDLIRGIFDGDGCITITKRTNPKLNTKEFKSYICSSSINLLESIKEYLKFGSIYEIIKGYSKRGIIQKNKHWRLTFPKGETLKLMRLMYYPDNKICLKRKENKYKEMEKILIEEEKFNRHLGDKWPTDEELINLLKTNTYSTVAKMLDVTPRAIIYRLEQKGLFQPSRNYV